MGPAKLALMSSLEISGWPAEREAFQQTRHALHEMLTYVAVILGFRLCGIVDKGFRTTSPTLKGERRKMELPKLRLPIRKWRAPMFHKCSSLAPI